VFPLLEINSYEIISFIYKLLIFFRIVFIWKYLIEIRIYLYIVVIFRRPLYLLWKRTDSMMKSDAMLSYST
jgi:hypothetical protein